jgi:hypothetical protein
MYLTIEDKSKYIIECLLEVDKAQFINLSVTLIKIFP